MPLFARPVAPELDPIVDFVFDKIPVRAARPELVPTSAPTLTEYPSPPSREDLRTRLTDAQRDRLASVKGRGVRVEHFHRARRLLEVWADGDDGTTARSIKLVTPAGTVVDVYRRVRQSLPPRVWTVPFGDEPHQAGRFEEAWEQAVHVALAYQRPLVEPDGTVIAADKVLDYHPAAHWTAPVRLEVVEPALLPGEDTWPPPQVAIGDAWIAEVARRGD